MKEKITKYIKRIMSLDSIVKIIKNSVILTTTLILTSLTIFVYAAISWPSTSPSGEISGGKFMDYFNKIFTQCPVGETLLGYDSTGNKICGEGGKWSNVNADDIVYDSGIVNVGTDGLVSGGPITMNAVPTLAKHTVTKEYVDALSGGSDSGAVQPGTYFSVGGDPFYCSAKKIKHNVGYNDSYIFNAESVIYPINQFRTCAPGKMCNTKGQCVAEINYEAKMEQLLTSKGWTKVGTTTWTGITTYRWEKTDTDGSTISIAIPTPKYDIDVDWKTYHVYYVDLDATVSFNGESFFRKLSNSSGRTRICSLMGLTGGAYYGHTYFGSANAVKYDGGWKIHSCSLGCGYPAFPSYCTINDTLATWLFN